MRFGPGDAGYEPKEQEPAYQQEMVKQGEEPQDSGSSMAGGGLGGWSSTLREINEILQQLNQMGIVQTGPQQQGAGMSMGRNQGQTPAQGQQTQQQNAEAQQSNIDMQVNQTFKQVQGGLQLLQQQEELGPDATLEETQQYVMQNEQQLKQLIKQFIQQQQGAGGGQK